MLIDGLDLIEGSINKNLVITNVTAAQKAVATQIDVGEIVFQTDGVSGLYIYHGPSLGWKLVSSSVDVNDATNLTTGTLAASRLPTSGVNAGTYNSVTVDTKGRVTAGTNPTTLAGFGITDAVSSTGSLATNTVDGTEAVGFRNVPQISQSADYTCALSDSGKHVFHPASDGTARTYTIPANSSVAYPIGTAITFVNMSTASVTIAINTDTMYFAGTGTTGSRTLAQYGTATALKISSSSWLISGVQLT